MRLLWSVWAHQPFLRCYSASHLAHTGVAQGQRYIYRFVSRNYFGGGISGGGYSAVLQQHPQQQRMVGDGFGGFPQHCAGIGGDGFYGHPRQVVATWRWHRSWGLWPRPAAATACPVVGGGIGGAPQQAGHSSCTQQKPIAGLNGGFGGIYGVQHLHQHQHQQQPSPPPPPPPINLGGGEEAAALSYGFGAGAELGTGSTWEGVSGKASDGKEDMTAKREVSCFRCNFIRPRSTQRPHRSYRRQLFFLVPSIVRSEAWSGDSGSFMHA